eukprot:911645-Pelagomonas_calceolata.AAC.1
MKHHNVFHVSLVKVYKVLKGEELNISTPLIEVDDEAEPAWKIEKIVNHRPVEIRFSHDFEYMVTLSLNVQLGVRDKK